MGVGFLQQNIEGREGWPEEWKERVIVDLRWI